VAEVYALEHAGLALVGHELHVIAAGRDARKQQSLTEIEAMVVVVQNLVHPPFRGSRGAGLVVGKELRCRCGGHPRDATSPYGIIGCDGI
jgi:hypothetical protein